MDNSAGNSLGEFEGLPGGEVESTPSSNGRSPKASTRKPPTRKPEPTRPDGTKRSHHKKKPAQAETILDAEAQQPEPKGLSEDEIDLLLKDLPEADDTPLPDAQFENFTSAAIVLTLLDGIVQMAVGPQYGMTKDERKMMQEPLDRIMARFPVAQLAAYGQYVDPLLLLMGLVSWGSRISRMKREEQKTSGKVTPPPSPKTPIKETTPSAVPSAPAPRPVPDLGEATAAPPAISSFIDKSI